MSVIGHAFSSFSSILPAVPHRGSGLSQNLAFFFFLKKKGGKGVSCENTSTTASTRGKTRGQEF